jgi:hypothetical protein
MLKPGAEERKAESLPRHRNIIEQKFRSSRPQPKPHAADTAYG